ncbi:MULTISPECIES: 16S rRNA (guanine(966)-N(2))-methyltransferase RsmD [Mesonia]|uniref:Ribosomal RNA small subunit methyltransferase D n=1 Tax=Mesonia oceanica TaxID=2687242 RepID=A0AC61Y6Z5_9FLAO|nr:MULTISPECIES: 16S rRNA (guanine(966)-N(2))-methyltransferase RsmD [Mesonia]MAN26740.1 16S rRNA (guanine(966)-N(2))-methyltransferase RsmD [Mesonia sp.]MAQ40444.1 16S rRNA (guanine(966)-N(2))-methyltransferase RsmD [Mesonia sp.]MBJ98065.1 16S rRNA (guanine(966)-N(2))-methyltransferase RsmD [Flavobacteriaceae bacterium]VVV00281.1 Ribosomal RNA small subunit methyltransferase D [Mesonia oceanica]|tara:strand:+ start:40328 stop:40867 length:540 start_codon:yes stop_codon:yes gene_type:complete
MRIISGKYKGKRLIAPKNLPVRPTTDMAKEALFNILNFQIDFENTVLLDLFSGTGNISYEFLSRGTTNITAVDQHFGCVKFINKTAKELDAEITTVKSDVFKYLEKVKSKNDIIFADPPYNFSEEEFFKIIELTFKNELLTEDGMLIIEHSKHTNLSNSPYFLEHRKYGNSTFSFFKVQ